MKHPPRRIRVSSHLALLAITILATADPTAVASSPYPPLAIEVDRSSLLVPTRVTYEWTEEGLEVKGRIEKKRNRYGRILGHAEIELLDADGRILSWHSGALQRFNPRRQDPDWASFQTVINPVPSDVVRLRICHSLGAGHCPR
jgi:hypothetical protein